MNLPRPSSDWRYVFLKYLPEAGLQYVVIRSTSPLGKKQALASLSQSCSQESSYRTPFPLLSKNILFQCQVTVAAVMIMLMMVST